MEQPTFADLEYDGKKRKTRRERFLERMDGLIPWDRLEDRIRPFYPKAGRGRRPYDLSVMLRIHCVQLFYNLSDPAMEDMLYEIESVRRFVGVRLSGPLPDETTILNFRHLLDTHDLGEGLFEEINGHLGVAWTASSGRDDSGCEHNRGAVVYEESGWRSRPRDAPDEEGQRVVLRDESAYWGGFSDGHGTQRMYDIGQRA